VAENGFPEPIVGAEKGQFRNAGAVSILTLARAAGSSRSA
jgi:hypothetical protein